MKHPRATTPAFLTLLLLAACSGGDGGTGPADQAPAITVSGVQDGGSYEPPVTIGIQVDQGSYSARLNGAAFISGGTISSPGSYELVVEARNGVATSSETVAFDVVPPTSSVGDVLTIRLIDLGDNPSIGGGGGDAILLTDSSAFGVFHAMIDAGPGASSESFARQRLSALGVDSLGFLQLTHAHSDHFAGMDEILNAIPVGTFVYNGQVRNLSFYQAVLDAAQAEAGSVVALNSLLAVEVGAGPTATTVTMVPPLSSYLNDGNASGDELNEGSIGTHVEHAAFRMFLTGDGEVEANGRWRTSFAALTGAVDVLKVGHHGANNAIFDDGSGFGDFTSTWLTHTAPAVAVISANGRSHPRSRAISKLLGEVTEVYCTSVHGDIRIRVDGDGNYQVVVDRNAGSDCVAGSEATS